MKQNNLQATSSRIKMKRKEPIKKMMLSLVIMKVWQCICKGEFKPCRLNLKNSMRNAQFRQDTNQVLSKTCFLTVKKRRKDTGF